MDNKLKTTTYKSTKISYSDNGKGTAVVLVHGFLENSTMWDSLAPELSKKYRVVTIDLLGHGKTDCLGYVHSMEDNAEMVCSVLAELRLRKVVLVGHSMGGYVALAFAELYPNYVKGVALINSTAAADSAERKSNRDRAIEAVKKDHSTFVRLSIANLFSEDNREKLRKVIEDAKKEALKTPLQGIIAALEGMKIRKDREALMNSVDYPILIILGKKDPVLPYDENASKVRNGNVELVSFNDGHMGPIENQDELQQELLSFLKKI